ncbi:MAG: hypothetical protein ACJAZW_000929 [Maritalea sp.]
MTTEDRQHGYALSGGGNYTAKLSKEKKMLHRTNFNLLGALVTLAASLTLTSVSGAMAQMKPGEMTASASGTALWQFPDKRALDPALFGTPDAPTNVELLPLDNRLVSDDGKAFTTIKNPSMFSNNIKMTTGEFKISVADVTAKDGMGSKDTVAMDASFIGPMGRQFRVTMNNIIPKGPDHPFFGGVGTNVLMHGETGIGTPLVAEEFSYITAWGLGDIYIDGEMVDSKRVVHVMVSERTRGDDYKVGFGVAKPDELEIHLAMPPLKGSPTGPVASAVPTGVTLPNGKEQPFIHVNFYGNASLEGNRFYAAK